MNEAPAPDTHRVVACLGARRTRLEPRPAPRPAGGEILLKLRVAGLCGTDLFKLASDSVTPGSVLGHEIVGEVAATGAGVAGFRPGDRVAVPHHLPCGRCHLCLSGNETMCPAFRDNLLDPGGFAELVLVRAPAVLLAARRLPPTLSDEAAVFLEPAACVLRGVNRSGLGDQGVAVVLGAGSMGLLHLLIITAARPGIAVVVVDPVTERRRLARALGAAAACEGEDAARAAVMSHSDGRGADAVFDTVGGARPLMSGLELSRHGGSVVLFAHAPAGQRANFDLNALFKFERRLVGTYSGGPAEQAAVFDWLCAGTLDPSPLVTHRLPLSEFDRGVALARERKALKILFTPGNPMGPATAS